MIRKIILLPFWILKQGIGAVIGVVRLVLGVGFGIFRFIFSRSIGTIAVVVIGFLLGKKYLEGKMGEEKKEEL
jgi:hypothetical protein